MQYLESSKQSVEYLRRVIPLISKHNIKATPINYAVWYEYISGNNPNLTFEIDQLLEKGTPFSDQLSEELYDKFIVGDNQETIKQLQTELQNLVANLSESTTKTDEEVGRFDQSLKRYNNQLEGQVDSAALQRIADGMLTDSRAMRASTSSLKARLEVSKAEIDSLRNELDEAKKEALTDSLTNLTNRKGFSKAFDESISTTDSVQLAPCLLMVDIDFFKRVNDTYGHVVGDQVIQFIGSNLKKQIKGKDTAARFGGEEFAVLLVETSLDGAHTVAENIRKVIESAQLVNKTTRQQISHVTVSVGVARYQNDESLESFVSRADEALYKSKQSGRNQVTLADREESNRTVSC